MDISLLSGEGLAATTVDPIPARTTSAQQVIAWRRIWVDPEGVVDLEAVICGFHGASDERFGKGWCDARYAPSLRRLHAVLAPDHQTRCWCVIHESDAAVKFNLRADDNSDRSGSEG